MSDDQIKGVNLPTNTCAIDHNIFFKDRYGNSSTTQIKHGKPPAIFCGLTAWYVSDMVINLDGRFSHDEAAYTCMLRV